MNQFIARQPIFDRKKNVFGYELLFRSGLDNFFDAPDQDKASSQVIANSTLLFGIEELCSGGKAFINVTRGVLLDDHAAVLPCESTVVEVLEDVEPDGEVIEACKRIKEKGFTLALDDFVYGPQFEALLDIVDIVKVDFLLSDEAERRRMAEAFIPRGIKMLAEKVETQEEFEQALEMGYDYFQGFFFSKPVILTRKDIPTSKLQYLQILKEMNAPVIDFRKLAEKIQGEVSISYRLLKLTNSSAFGLSRKITSILQALALLGEREFRKCLSLAVLSGMSDDKPHELIVSSMIRAKFCEQVADLLGETDRKPDLFLMGLFSHLDAILDRPLEEVLSNIPMDDDVLVALLNHEGQLGDLLRVISSLERGDWEGLLEYKNHLGLAEAPLAEAYSVAIQWAIENSSLK